MKLEILFPILILTAGFLYFIIPRIIMKYFTRPDIFIEVNPNEGLVRGRLMIRHLPNESVKYANSPEAENLYELNWKFNLIIRNNSENSAYNIKMYSTKPEVGKLLFAKSVNENKPLAAHEELLLPFEYKQEKVCKLKDIGTLDSKEPDFFKSYRILLDYKNSGKTRFNSVFEASTKAVSYKKISNRKIKKNWC